MKLPLFPPIAQRIEWIDSSDVGQTQRQALLSLGMYGLVDLLEQLPNPRLNWEYCHATNRTNRITDGVDRERRICQRMLRLFGLED